MQIDQKRRKLDRQEDRFDNAMSTSLQRLREYILLQEPITHEIEHKISSKFYKAYPEFLKVGTVKKDNIKKFGASAGLILVLGDHSKNKNDCIRAIPQIVQNNVSIQTSPQLAVPFSSSKSHHQQTPVAIYNSVMSNNLVDKLQSSMAAVDCLSKEYQLALTYELSKYNNQLTKICISARSHFHASPTDLYIFDLIACPDIMFNGKLNQLLSQKSSLKIVHDCNSIASALKSQFNVIIANVIDLQVAYATLSIRQIQTDSYYISYRVDLATVLRNYAGSNSNSRGNSISIPIPAPTFTNGLLQQQQQRQQFQSAAHYNSTTPDFANDDATKIITAWNTMYGQLSSQGKLTAVVQYSQKKLLLVQTARSMQQQQTTVDNRTSFPVPSSGDAGVGTIMRQKTTSQATAIGTATAASNNCSSSVNNNNNNSNLADNTMLPAERSSTTKAKEINNSRTKNSNIASSATTITTTTEATASGIVSTDQNKNKNRNKMLKGTSATPAAAMVEAATAALTVSNNNNSKHNNNDNASKKRTAAAFEIVHSESESTSECISSIGSSGCSIYKTYSSVLGSNSCTKNSKAAAAAVPLGKPYFLYISTSGDAVCTSETALSTSTANSSINSGDGVITCCGGTRDFYEESKDLQRLAAVLPHHISYSLLSCNQLRFVTEVTLDLGRLPCIHYCIDSVAFNTNNNNNNSTEMKIDTSTTATTENIRQQLNTCNNSNNNSSSSIVIGKDDFPTMNSSDDVDNGCNVLNMLTYNIDDRVPNNIIDNIDTEKQNNDNSSGGDGSSDTTTVKHHDCGATNTLAMNKKHDEVIVDKQMKEGHMELQDCGLVTQADLDQVCTVDTLGDFTSDNRAGVKDTLHRVSRKVNRSGQLTIALTLRIGRMVIGSTSMIADIVYSGRSVLLLGAPGVGKTVLLREYARVLAASGKRVEVIDTSNEIAGDSDEAHKCIGSARRMMVGQRSEQHKVMVEAVQNHTPQCIIVDEIGTALEAIAAGDIVQRGVQLVATAHGTSLSQLLRNPDLNLLVGGVHNVILGDDETRHRNHKIKTIQERKAHPVFDTLIELHSRHRWAIYHNLTAAVDSMLRGRPPVSEVRYIDEGAFKVIKEVQKHN